MGTRFQELDWRRTPMGEISLRRRWDPRFEAEVHEIKLDDEFLMSSLFTVGEVELARLALAAAPDTRLDVAVGGLGLGYTARAVLEHPSVRSLLVVEALEVVIEWHQRRLLPAGATLAEDPRCRFQPGDFFALLASATGLDPEQPGRRFHSVIVDIDHSPRHLLHPDHAGFYQSAGLRRLAGLLHPGGGFALWSNDPPDEQFLTMLAEVFPRVHATRVEFPNPLQGRPAANTVYLASMADSD